MEVPSHPLPLKKGVGVDVWNYKQTVQDVEEREAEALAKLKLEQRFVRF